MRPATLLHTADVHLGISRAEEEAFERAIDLAVEIDVDCVLIAGDLFDHSRVPDELLGWTAAQLERAGRPVVLLSGNHDTLHDASVYNRFRVTERCSHVYLLADPGGSTVGVPNTDIVVWGRAMIEHEPRYQPLGGLPAKPEECWGVVAAHGLVLEDDKPTHHGSPITPSELGAIVGWDYVALGHHHGHRVHTHGSAPAVYPGYTARSFKGEPGVILVNFSPVDGMTFEWTSLA